MKISVNENIPLQKFTGFGASGAWWAQLAGKWDSPNKDRLMSLLYDRDNGIGLYSYRFNIGAGSVREAGRYWNEERRTECFCDGNGYDFGKDEAAVYMLKKAVESGAKEVTFFVNSPPNNMTKNGLSQLKKRQYFRTNLSSSKYGDFADFCFDVCEHFIKEGLPVRYLSPVNEPLWIWNGGQEGCHYSPLQVRKLFGVFCKKLENRPELFGLKLSGAENGDIRWFNRCYTLAVLGNRNIYKHTGEIHVHSYCTHLPLPLVNNRDAYLKRFRKFMDRHFPDADIVMSEWTHMRGGKDSGMDSAMVCAKTIHNDINLLGAVKWEHWIACSTYDYCDGLIYIDDRKQDFEITKRYYVTGNFSKFLPENSHVVFSECDDKELYITAFSNGEKTVAVVTNPTGDAKTAICENNSECYITDKDSNLEKTAVSAGDEMIFRPVSVTTVVWNTCE